MHLMSAVPARRVVQEVPRLQTVSMPNVLVRDVPEEVHAGLRRRAESRGQSLQQYLQEELRHLAEGPTIKEVLDRVEQQLASQDRGDRENVPFDTVKAIHEAREERDQQIWDAITRRRNP
jgi:plasmid stability protein